MPSSAKGCRKHRRAFTVLALVLAALLTGACSSGLSVRSDEDPSADFSKYQSWNFFDPLGIEGGYNSPIFGQLFREAITREMKERGYRMSDQPDLMINVTIKSDDKISMRTYSAPYMSGAYYRRPGGYYGSGVGMGVGVSSRATKTTEVSVFIDLVDREKQRVSWQGVAVTDATDKTAKRLRDAIYTAVNNVFDKYPHKAGK